MKFKNEYIEYLRSPSFVSLQSCPPTRPQVSAPLTIFQMSSFSRENPTLSEYLGFTLAIQNLVDVEACCLEEKFESLMMERGSVMKEFLRAGDIGATRTVAAMEACHLKQKCESLMTESRNVMEDFLKYSAVKALTAEESIHIGKHMIRWELPRLNTTHVSVTMDLGGSGMGTEMEAGAHMDLGSQGLSWEKVQSSIESSSTMKSQDNAPTPLPTGDRRIKNACKHKKVKANDSLRRPLSAYNIFFSQMRTKSWRRAKSGSMRLATRSI